MIEKKTTKQILENINSTIVGTDGKYDIIKYEEFKEKIWIPKEDLINHLKQFLQEDLDSSVEDCYLYSRIESFIDELEEELQ
jgi:pectate lyase